MQRINKMKNDRTRNVDWSCTGRRKPARLAMFLPHRATTKTRPETCTWQQRTMRERSCLYAIPTGRR